jgi:hypothetical protein
MTFVNQKDFALMLGVSAKTVSLWKKARRLVMKGNQVDVEQSRALLDRYRKGGSPTIAGPVTLPITLGEKGNRKGNSTESIESELSEIIEPGESIEAAAERLVSAIDVDMSFDEARRVKEVYLAFLNRLEYERKSGSLIDLAAAEGVVFDAFRAQRDAWLNWPSKVGPRIAAELGIEEHDKVVDVLTAHIHKQISALGAPQVDFGAETTN